MTKGRTRVLFYSHDTFGLGHIRRTLAISRSVSRSLRDASVLVATGSSLLPSLRLPPAVDYVKLPCVTKVGDDRYEAKTLGLEFEHVRSLREAILFAAATSFAPHLLFVDNVPLGMKGEMLPTLQHVRQHSPDTRVILNLRDVLDEPDRVVGKWTAESTYEAIDRFYDRVMVYGAPEIFDVVREYRLPPAVARKVEYAGYIRSRAPKNAVRQIRRQLTPGGERLVLVTVGGGGDGRVLVDQYLRGMAAIDGSVSTRTLVVLGPEMPDDARRSLRARSAGDPRISFTDFQRDLATYVAAADVVVSMGGYNTVCEILSFGKPSVIIPRVEPRLEQWIRCQRLAELGLVTMIHPREVTPERLMDEVRRLLTAKAQVRADVSLNFGGLHAVSAMARAYAQ